MTYYRYPGLIFSSRNVSSKALSTLASQAEKALSIVRRIIWKVGHPKLHVSFKIFDSRIVPILYYGSETWGHTYQDQIWSKLLKSDKASLVHAIYQTQIHLDKIYKQGWVTDLKRLLFTDGFGHVWISD